MALGEMKTFVTYMRKYVTGTEDTCWRDCLGCILEINPKRVPNFVKLYGNKYMDSTRDWLKDNFNKGLVYIPARCFMETSEMRDNPPIGPSGYSIAHLSMVEKTAMHVVIAFNGGIVYDNGESRENEYGSIQGYFVLYDIETPKAKWIKKVRKRNRRKTS